MKSLLEKYRWVKIVLGVILIALGVTTMVLALTGNSGNLDKIICIMIAVYCLLLGTFGLVLALVAEAKLRLAPLTTALLTFGAIIGFGIVLLVALDQFAGVMATIIMYSIPWILIGAGTAAGIKFIVDMCFAKTRSNVKAWLIALLAAVLFLTTGTILWINITSVGTVLYTIIGIIVILIGIVVLVAGILDVAHSKKASKNEVATK